MNKPCLPQDDPLVPIREQEIAKAKKTYRYDRSTEGLLFAEEVPNRDKGGLEYWARLAAVNLEVSINKAVTRTPEERHAAMKERLSELASKLHVDQWTSLRNEMFSEAGEAHTGHHPVASAEEYARDYAGPLREPTTMSGWDRDEVFAWRALAGDFPYALTRLTEPLDKLPVTEAQYQRIAGTDDSLADALSEGRLYLIDHARFDGIEGGTVDGYPKYLDAPIGLYAQTPSGWKVIGIQSGQDPDVHRFHQPGDGWAWKMARVSHAVADAHAAGLEGHFGLCHIVVEGLVLASKRCLAGRHPLRHLLDAHTQNTLIVNEITRTSLTPEGGGVDRLMSPTREVSLRLTREAVERLRIMESGPVEDFARRGVDDLAALPSYPGRDDSLLLWEAISEWVERYVRTFYADDAAVQADSELADFVSELQDPDQGGLLEIGEIRTVDRLVHLLQRLVFRASAWHASINYSLFDFGYAPSEPTAQYGPGPGDTEPSEQAWLAMFPPTDLAYEVIESYYPLQVRINQLGDYDRTIAKNKDLASALERYRARLKEIEATIETRNADRLMPYVVQLPSRVSNSVHV